MIGLMQAEGPEKYVQPESHIPRLVVVEQIVSELENEYPSIQDYQ